MGVRENSVAFEDTSAASLYQELNFKIATSQAFIDKMKHTAKRRARVNYLARKTPYVLSELLDHKYWKTHKMWFRTDLETIRAKIQENRETTDLLPAHEEFKVA